MPPDDEQLVYFINQEQAAKVRAEAFRLGNDIDLFIKMGFRLSELAIMSGVDGERDQVVVRSMVEEKE